MNIFQFGIAPYPHGCYMRDEQVRMQWISPGMTILRGDPFGGIFSKSFSEGDEKSRVGIDTGEFPFGRARYTVHGHTTHCSHSWSLGINISTMSRNMLIPLGSGSL